MPEPERPRPRYTITLNSSEVSVAKYGIVEFLKRRPAARACVGSMAVIFTLMIIVNFFGFSGTFSFLRFSSGILIFLTPTLFWLATVSGPSFELVFGESQAAKAREKAEETLEHSVDAEDALKADLSRLNEY